MSDLESLIESRSQLIARLNEITKKKKPTYSWNGKQISWNEYRQALIGDIKNLNELISDEDEGNIVEVSTIGLI